MHETATAHRAWDEAWRSEDGRADWLVPDQDVITGARISLEQGGRRALDLGCGVGRHALVLATAGFDVSAIDASDTGIEHLNQEAGKAGLDIDTRVGLMTELPYEDDAFDYVVAFNVIYHGDGKVVRWAISEIGRVLKPSGIYQGTMLSKDNTAYGKGEEIAADTFVAESGGDGDKDHPHFYCDEPELYALFAGFEILTLAQREHREPGSWHWHMLAQLN